MRSVTQVSSPIWKASSLGNNPHPLGQGVKSSLCQQCWRLVPSASPCFSQKPIPGLCWALVVTLGLNLIFFCLLSIQNIWNNMRSVSQPAILWARFCGHVLHLLEFGFGPAGCLRIHELPESSAREVLRCGWWGLEKKGEWKLLKVISVSVVLTQTGLGKSLTKCGCGSADLCVCTRSLLSSEYR